MSRPHDRSTARSRVGLCVGVRRGPGRSACSRCSGCCRTAVDAARQRSASRRLLPTSFTLGQLPLRPRRGRLRDVPAQLAASSRCPRSWSAGCWRCSPRSPSRGSGSGSAPRCWSWCSSCRWCRSRRWSSRCSSRSRPAGCSTTCSAWSSSTSRSRCPSPSGRCAASSRPCPRSSRRRRTSTAASWPRMFWSVLLPLVAPGLVATSVFAFITAWNEFVFAITFMNDQGSYTVAAGLRQFFTQYGTDWGAVMAGSTLITLPVMIFFVIVQRRLSRRPGRRCGEGMSTRRLALSVLLPGFLGPTRPRLAARAAGRRARRGLPVRAERRFRAAGGRPDRGPARGPGRRAGRLRRGGRLGDPAGRARRVPVAGTRGPGRAGRHRGDLRVATALGAAAAASGVDLVLAPVLDVNSEPDNPVIGVRSFGPTPDLVSRHGVAFVTGLARGGVAGLREALPGARRDPHRLPRRAARPRRRRGHLARARPRALRRRGPRRGARGDDRPRRRQRRSTTGRRRCPRGCSRCSATTWASPAPWSATPWTCGRSPPASAAARAPCSRWPPASTCSASATPRSPTPTTTRQPWRRSSPPSSARSTTDGCRWPGSRRRRRGSRRCPRAPVPPSGRRPTRTSAPPWRRAR